jgi:peptidoglycan/LPS O-acetylase OafA/YrhL
MTMARTLGGARAARVRSALVRSPDPARRVKPEIQALRAVAVGAVVIFHFWPARLPGAYAGVDVFFVISGYLIIGSLLREVRDTGRVRLVDFWARRARRLIPASLVTLLAVTLGVVMWVPRVSWIPFIHEIGAAAVYALNWVLAANSVDYLASQNAPSPVQHFWSLSVEEQFYIAWPLLIVVTLALVVRLRPATRQRVLMVVLVAIVAASAVFSVIATNASQPSAYFFTTTRAWEFGAGGILAAVLERTPSIRPALAAALGWGGIAAIGASFVAFNAQTAFPGWVAWLPVGGSLMVIAGGLPTPRWSLSLLFRLRPVQWVGDISYSLYLWHWPLIVIAPLALHRELGTTSRVGLLIVALAIAWASKTWIEDPFRRSARLRRRGPWFAAVATVVITAIALTGSLVWTGSMESAVAQAKKEALHTVTADGSCLGSDAFGPQRVRTCLRPFAVTALTDPAVAATDIGRGVQVADKCKQTGEDSAVIACRFGAAVHPVHHVALIGDSHAGVLLEPLHASGVRSCTDWGASAIRDIAADPTIDVVVFSNFTRHYDVSDVGSLGRPVNEQDFRSAWSSLIRAGKKVVVIRDTPDAGNSLAPQCIAEHLADYDPCATPKAVAVVPASDDPQWSAVLATPAVTGIDLTDDFCDADVCHTVIGGLIVYFDSHHLTATFARTLAPYLGEQISRAIS